MNTFLRFALLAFFVCCGVAVAVAVATTTKSTDVDRKAPSEALQTAKPTDPAPAEVAAEPIEIMPPTRAPRAASPTKEQQHVLPAVPPTPESLPFGTQPVFARPAPPVTQQVKPSEPTLPVSTMIELFDKVFSKSQNAAQNPNNAQPPAEGLPEPRGASPEATAPKPSTSVVAEADDRISLHLNNTDIREVLELISRASGMNILATSGVQGTVTASLNNVDVRMALEGVLKSTGYVIRQEGDILYVGTVADFQLQALATTKIGTRVFRPNYITAAELQALISPLLTPDIGTISISGPAEQGIPSDSTSVGGDSYADSDVVLVRDYLPVLDEIDQVFQNLDKRPMQVAIEAMILSVKLDDSNKLGVDFELLRDQNNIRLISGMPLNSLTNIDTTEGGLKVGFLDSNLSIFLNALETVGDTNVIATPRLLALNKQRAEILIGAQLGYVSSTVTETALTQTVEFLEVGTQLRIRPFISSDGMIRMEVHPELSTGSVRVEGGFTLPDKDVTEVTTNIMAQDGSTVIIGGLIREDLASSATQIPLFGSLPGVGFMFRQKKEDIDRREILVLITPHIVYEPELSSEGDHEATEFHHRQAVKFRKTSWLGQRRIGQKYFIKAQQAWADGNARRAMKFANLAIHYNPQNRAAIDLRADIWEGFPAGDHSAGMPFQPTSPLDGETIAPWLLDQMDPRSGAIRPRHPIQPGVPGPRADILTPHGSAL